MLYIGTASRRLPRRGEHGRPAADVPNHVGCGLRHSRPFPSHYWRHSRPVQRLLRRYMRRSAAAALRRCVDLSPRRRCNKYQVLRNAHYAHHAPHSNWIASHRRRCLGSDLPALLHNLLRRACRHGGTSSWPCLSHDAHFVGQETPCKVKWQQSCQATG